MRIKEIITICLLFVSVSLLAQEKTIEVTGVVTDTNKEPLVGVNVTVKDKPGLGAITDINGRYKNRGIFSFGILVYWFRYARDIGETPECGEYINERIGCQGNR